MKGILNEMAGMTAFVRVVQTGSFSAAAKSLGSTPSAASKSISRLETHLGVRLFRRSTRNMSLTIEGESFYARVLPLLQEIESVADVVHGSDSIMGHLRVGLPGELGLHILKPILMDFVLEYPAVTMEIYMSDRHADVLKENLDVVFRVGGATQVSLMSRTLAHLEMVLVASPVLTKQFGAAESIPALLRMPFVRYSMDGRPYPIRFADGTEIVPNGKVDMDSGAAIREAALIGVGAAHLIKRLVQDDIDRGNLVELVPPIKLQAMSLQAIHASGRSPPQRLQALTDFVGKLMRTTQEWDHHP
jgi:DNA-binding transcriptional LysR family regulator